MLAQPADDAAVALERLGGAAFEYKLDGARVQVHKRDEVRVYCRGLNEVTGSVPELVEAGGGRAARACSRRCGARPSVRVGGGSRPPETRSPRLPARSRPGSTRWLNQSRSR
jgi:hypothetical protein